MPVLSDLSVLTMIFISPPQPPHLTKDLPLPIKFSTYSQGKPKFKK